jgi:hypothetical protein
MGVHVQRDVAARGRQLGKSRNADSDVISHAGSFDHGLAGMFGEEPSAQVGNHVAILAADERSRTRIRGVKGLEF